MFKFRNSAIGYFLILLFSVFFVMNANALTTSPLRFDLTLFPGSSSEATFMVENNELEPAAYKVFINSLVATPDGKIFFEKNSDSAEKWVDVDVDSFSLAPGQGKLVKIKMSVPLGERPGSRSLAIMVKKENAKGQIIGISTQNAIPLLLTVAGVVNEKVQITSWEPKQKIFGKNNLGFLLQIQNTGNVNVDAIGALRIKDLFGREVAEQPVRLGTTIFSNSSRGIKVSSSPKLLPGVYKAEILVKYGQLNTVLKGVVTFFYIPVWSVIAFVVLICAGVGTFWFRRKGYAKKI